MDTKAPITGIMASISKDGEPIDSLERARIWNGISNPYTGFDITIDEEVDGGCFMITLPAWLAVKLVTDGRLTITYRCGLHFEMEWPEPTHDKDEATAIVEEMI